MLNNSTNISAKNLLYCHIAGNFIENRISTKEASSHTINVCQTERWKRLKSPPAVSIFRDKSPGLTVTGSYSNTTTVYPNATTAMFVKSIR